MNKEIEILQELQGVIKNAANTVSRLMEIKKEREGNTPEVKGVDWEIESFWCEATKEYHVLHLNGLYCSKKTRGGYACDATTAINNPNLSIFSVRRLSDNVVFSLGDKIDMDDCGHKPIDAFLVGGKGKELGHTENDLWISTNQKKEYGTLIEYASKLQERTKLFATLDGKDIFAGDKYWFVSSGDWSMGESLPASHGESNEHWKTFSTEDAAKEYVFINKPFLSVADIVTEWCISGDPRKKLIELAKRKQQ